MDLSEYYQEVVKTAGLSGVTEDEVEAAIEVLKTAGLIEDQKESAQEEEVSEEKIAAVTAVSEQFDLDGISFENEDEKIAAAIMIVEGYEEEAEKEAKLKGLAGRVLRAGQSAAGKVDDVVAGSGKEALKPGSKARLLLTPDSMKGIKKDVLKRRALAYGGAGAAAGAGGYGAYRALKKD